MYHIPFYKTRYLDETDFIDSTYITYIKFQNYLKKFSENLDIKLKEKYVSNGFKC